MAEHADTVRELVCDLLDEVNAGMTETRSTLAALDALVAERDEARAANEGRANLILHEALIARAEAAEARVAELEAKEKLLLALLYEDDGFDGVVPQLHRSEARVALLEKALADDEAVMRGVAAVRKMGMLRVGDMHDHAEAFRVALAAGGDSE